jgi:PST family polysaccharide transporter
VSIFKDLGTSAAIIQKKELKRDFLSSIFWLNIFLGIFFTILTFLISSSIANIYNENRISNIIKVLSLSFFFSSTSILHQTLLEKKMEFKKIARAELVSSFIGSLVGITLAQLGFGVWSLVFQSLTIAIVNSTVLWFLMKWVPSVSFSINHIKSVFKFSSNLTGFNIFNYLVRNSDSFLIGKFLGSEILGYYTLAYKLMLYPIQNISGVVSRVMFPLYSQINDDNKLKDIYTKVTLGIAFFTFPIMLGLVGLGDILIISVFGEKWRLTGTILMILAPVGLLQSIDTTTGSIYLAKGRTDIMFRWGFLTGLLTALSFIIGLNWGIIGIAVSYLIINIAWLYPAYYIPFRLINLEVKKYFKKFIKPLMLSSIVFLFILITRNFLSINLKVELLILTVTGVIVYGIINYLFNRTQLIYLFDIIMHKNR